MKHCSGSQRNERGDVTRPPNRKPVPDCPNWHFGAVTKTAYGLTTVELFGPREDDYLTVSSIYGGWANLEYKAIEKIHEEEKRKSKK